jgi:M6 family metalloprotease-like protein
MRPIHRVVSVGMPLALFAALVQATPPPPTPGGNLPEAFLERREENPRAFTFRNALIGQVRRIQNVRAQARATVMTAEEVSAAGGIAVAGERFIPVLPVLFLGTPNPPYPVADLQRELFDGPFPTGTMKDYYLEVSYNRLTVNGEVHPWQPLSRNDLFYQGADFIGDNGRTQPCHGMCRGAGTGDLLEEALQANDGNIDFGSTDNDGPDGRPNSGDDDGFVDFVAFVHPEVGGECENAVSTRNIWSHRWTYDAWKGQPFVTNDRKTGGGFIQVNDYVIVPALACDDRTMIQIGVFAHEFGHAFGLPDLYDTDDDNGKSEGVGNWCLMSGGTWGGDGDSPERPAHLSAWAKAELGWIVPDRVSNAGRFRPALVTPSERTPLAYRIPISRTQYYLIENRQREGFDDRLQGAGLLIWKINESVVEAGRISNRVNADETNKGVELVQADDLDELSGVGDRGDDGDVFAGSTDKRSFHNRSAPRSVGRVAVCDISDSDPADFSMTATLLATSGACPTSLRATPEGPGPAAGRTDGTDGRGGAAERPADVASALSIAEIRSHPERFLGRPVRVTGRLLNAGTGYFKDRRIVLEDAAGNEIDIRPWLPLEVPPGLKGQPALSSYLDKRIEVVGELERTTVEGQEAFVLTVDSAEVVPPR